MKIIINGKEVEVSDFTYMEHVVISDSVTEIGDWAFCGCASLESITIPDSVTKIGDGAFCGCKSLKSVIIPDSVTKIGYRAFDEDCNII